MIATLTTDLDATVYSPAGRDTKAKLYQVISYLERHPLERVKPTLKANGVSVGIPDRLVGSGSAPDRSGIG